ncbi:hypothetical protein E4T56_gene11590 [Termitomyces sp. T112]|nr:hypothetical protein E4T56_gene11590 [Termitomyces sp. T112]
MDLCLNPTKPVPLLRNLSSTPPDLPGLAQINFPQLSSQVPSAWNTSECPVVSAGNHVRLYLHMYSRGFLGAPSAMLNPTYLPLAHYYVYAAPTAVQNLLEQPDNYSSS